MTQPLAAGSSVPRNQILGALPREEYARMASHLEKVHLVARQLVYDVNQPIEHVVFPENCVISILGVMADGTAVETATVGDEGMVGMPVFHGTDRASSQAFCQVEGDALRMTAGAFRTELARARKLPDMLHRYSQALFTLIGQSSACNRIHRMQQRCARWLLHTHDRVGYSRGVHEFNLTQSFLSQMLGVRRATVTEAMGSLQEAGCISYQMGRIAILDRARLEAVCCECYAIVRSEFDRLLGDAQSHDASPSPLEGLETSKGGKSTVEGPQVDE